MTAPTREALYRAIMNMPVTVECGPNDPYRYGHRDARHAAAELVLTFVEADVFKPEPPATMQGVTTERSAGK